MPDRPIIFSAPMVRALLAGRKTQTRRVLKPMPGMQSKWLRMETLHLSPTCYLISVDGKLGAQMQHPLAGQWSGGVYNDPMSPLTWVRLPYAPGDRLYVREAHKLIDQHCDYRADWPEGSQRLFSWRPSIHMPRWASRLTLTVTDVRVQRLHDIKTQDCIAEGISPDLRDAMERAQSSDLAQRRAYHETYVSGYRTLWNSLHGPTAWDENPWVVALTFTVEKRNIDAGGA
jgi:hypothetical protein